MIYRHRGCCVVAETSSIDELRTGLGTGKLEFEVSPVPIIEFACKRQSSLVSLLVPRSENLHVIQPRPLVAYAQSCAPLPPTQREPFFLFSPFPV